MGLDNGFELKQRSNSEFSVELARFRKFYELDNWVGSNCNPVNQDFDDEFVITYQDLEDLENELSDAFKYLSGLTSSEVLYMEHNDSWPENIRMLNYDKHFDFTSSKSVYCSEKIKKLYMSVNSMMEILLINTDDFYITFYSSY